MFTPGRAQRLAAQLPVTDTAAAAARATDTAALKARIKKFKALEQFPDSPATAAVRGIQPRRVTRFPPLTARIGS